MSIALKIFVLAIFLLLFYASITDFLKREIKNKCVLLILIFSTGIAFCLGSFNLFIPGLTLLFGFLLTLIGVIGAGDIKLIVALLIGMPEAKFELFFFATSCLGAPIAIIVFFISRYILKTNSDTVPFGIAISIGYITAMSGVF